MTERQRLFDAQTKLLYATPVVQQTRVAQRGVPMYADGPSQGPGYGQDPAETQAETQARVLERWETLNRKLLLLRRPITVRVVMEDWAKKRAMPGLWSQFVRQLLRKQMNVWLLGEWKLQARCRRQWKVDATLKQQEVDGLKSQLAEAKGALANNDTYNQQLYEERTRHLVVAAQNAKANLTKERDDMKGQLDEAKANLATKGRVLIQQQAAYNKETEELKQLHDALAVTAKEQIATLTKEKDDMQGQLEAKITKLAEYISKHAVAMVRLEESHKHQLYVKDNQLANCVRDTVPQIEFGVGAVQDAWEKERKELENKHAKELTACTKQSRLQMARIIERYSQQQVDMTINNLQMECRILQAQKSQLDDTINSLTTQLGEAQSEIVQLEDGAQSQGEKVEHYTEQVEQLKRELADSEQVNQRLWAELAKALNKPMQQDAPRVFTTQTEDDSDDASSDISFDPERHVQPVPPLQMSSRHGTAEQRKIDQAVAALEDAVESVETTCVEVYNGTLKITDDLVVANRQAQLADAEKTELCAKVEDLVLAFELSEVLAGDKIQLEDELSAATAENGLLKRELKAVTSAVTETVQLLARNVDAQASTCTLNVAVDREAEALLQAAESNVCDIQRTIDMVLERQHENDAHTARFYEESLNAVNSFGFSDLHSGVLSFGSLAAGAAATLPSQASAEFEANTPIGDLFSSFTLGK